MIKERRLWKEEEDQVLNEVVARLGVKSWSKVAEAIRERLPDFARLGKQCRQRWINYLRPSVSGGHEEWSTLDQDMLIHHILTHGMHWSAISKLMNQRSENSVKNYFYTSLKNTLKDFARYPLLKNYKTVMHSLGYALEEAREKYHGLVRELLDLVFYRWEKSQQAVHLQAVGIIILLKDCYNEFKLKKKGRKVKLDPIKYFNIGYGNFHFSNKKIEEPKGQAT